MIEVCSMHTEVIIDKPLFVLYANFAGVGRNVYPTILPSMSEFGGISEFP